MSNKLINVVNKNNKAILTALQIISVIMIGVNLYQGSGGKRLSPETIYSNLNICTGILIILVLVVYVHYKKNTHGKIK